MKSSLLRFKLEFMFGVGLLFVSSLSFAGHGYLVATHKIEGTDLFSDFQEIFEAEKDYFQETEYVRSRSIWNESSNQSVNHRKSLMKSSQVDSTRHLTDKLVLEYSPAGLYVHYSIINMEDGYTANRYFLVEFVEGNWNSYVEKKHFLLRIAPSDQVTFNKFMKERLELMVRSRFKASRKYYKSYGQFIEGIRTIQFRTLKNNSAANYFSHFQPNSKIDTTNQTYFFGELASGTSAIVASYPDYQIVYELKLSHLPDHEMNWENPKVIMSEINSLKTVDLTE